MFIKNIINNISIYLYNMSYKEKYLKYKTKYIDLKKQRGEYYI
jgi:hypothetical protein